MKDTSAFLEFVGDTPVTRLLDFLITGRDFDYTLTDLSTKAGVSWTTLNRILPSLLKKSVIIETRKIGRIRLYKINTKNEIVQKLIELYQLTLLNQLKKFDKKEAIKNQDIDRDTQREIKKYK